VRVAIVYDAVYPYVKGGAERRYFELASRLARSGHEVHWYGMKWWAGPRVRRQDGITYHGVCRARPLYTKSGRRSILQALVFGVASFALVARRFDVVDCCGFPFFSTFAVKLATIVRGGRLISTWHEVWGLEYWRAYLGPLGPVGAFVEMLAARVPAAVLAVSDETCERVRPLVGTATRIRVLPNGVDVRRIDRMRASPEKSDLVYVGRLVDFKNVELLLEAMVVLVGRLPALTCTVVGDGPHRAQLEQVARDSGVADRVTFTGVLDDADEVYARMKSAAVLVLPSRREGFGIVVLEANASGAAVVVVDFIHNAARELVRGSNGRICESSAHAVAKAVQQELERDPEERRAACREFASGYDWDLLAKQYGEWLLEEATCS
jgi:glycosyltransferase involved in cell wall biosynthesis